MKFGIFSFMINSILLQQQIFLFNYFIKNDYDFYIVDDSKYGIDLKIEKNIKKIRVPQNIHKIQNPSDGYATTLNYISTYITKNIFDIDVVLIIHGDVFPICDTNFETMMKNNDICLIRENRKLNNKIFQYIYPNMVFLNNRTIDISKINYKCCHFIENENKIIICDCGERYGCKKTDKYIIGDTGASSYEFLNVNKLKEISLTLQNSNLIKNDISKEFINNMMTISKKYNSQNITIYNNLCHFIDGTNWKIRIKEIKNPGEKIAIWYKNIQYILNHKNRINELNNYINKLKIYNINL